MKFEQGIKAEAADQVAREKYSTSRNEPVPRCKGEAWIIKAIVNFFNHLFPVNVEFSWAARMLGRQKLGTEKFLSWGSVTFFHRKHIIFCVK